MPNYTKPGQNRQAGKDLREEQDTQQLKAFTLWWNSWLQKRVPPSPMVTDLCEEIKPGVISMHLIELLSASDAGKYNESPSLVFHMNENHDRFFALLESKNIDYKNIGAADLTDGNRALNLKSVLSLTWTLIQHYEEVENDTLLDWVKQFTND